MNWAGNLADVVLTLHFSIAAFVVAGLFLVIFGNLCNWLWVNNRWFRLAHIGAIGVVMAEAWLGVTCPLTTLEMRLRAKANATTYSGGFIEHWLQHLLYYEAPSWVFVLGYSLFGLLVLATWCYFPPNLKCRRNK
ncbi:MAG: DUF2784 domain-containing protein [Deltaproteobacteria bacterium]|nr:DUF2784 domain-containing protein [Deltaproteobacteria bacterium]